MAITHIIAHRLQSNGETGATLFLRESELTIDESKEELLDKLKSSYRSRLNRKHGSFIENENGSILANELDAYLQKQHSFAQLSQAIMTQLEKSANEEKLVFDAHFLFFADQHNEQHLFYLFVVSQSESLAINETLEVTPTYAIDTGVSLFGIRVDVAEWKRRPKSAYLSMIPPRNNPGLSDAFHLLTGFSNDLDKEEATLSFLEGIEAFTQHVPEEKVNDYRNKVVEYCMEQDLKDEPVDITTLSQNLEGIDVDKFIREMLPHNPKREDGEDEELMIDRRSLRRYTKFSGREKDLSISFSSHQLNNRVYYNQDTDTLTVTGIPKALRKQLLEHLGAKE